MPFLTDARLARAIGARVRMLREERGVTQESVAWACDLSKPYLSLVESGKRLPTLPVITAIASELGVHAVDIVGFDLRNPRLRNLDASRSRPAQTTILGGTKKKRPAR